MKKTYLYILLCICTGAFLMASCAQEEWGVGNIKHPDGAGGGEWNKNKTIDIYYLTELKDAGVSGYGTVADFFLSKGAVCSLGVIDRSDVNHAIRTYGPTEVAFKSAHFSSFAFNKYEGTVMQGSTILFNHKINSEKSFRVADDCFVKFIPLQVKTATTVPLDIAVPFSTVRFDTKEQVAASEPVFKTLSGSSYEAMVVGTIKKELLPDLKTVADKLSGYKLTEAIKDENADYAIFILSLKSWVLRETTIQSVSGDFNAYRLSVEASVE